MNQHLNANDISAVVETDRAHIWHHLSQHAAYENVDPRIIVEGKGMRVWDAHGKEHIDAVSGGVWTVNVGYGRESIANAVRDQLIKLNYFAQTAGSIPGSMFAEKLLQKMPGLRRMKKYSKWFGRFLRKSTVVRKIRFYFVIVIIMELLSLVYPLVVNLNALRNMDHSRLDLFKSHIAWSIVANLKILIIMESKWLRLQKKLS